MNPMSSLKRLVGGTRSERGQALIMSIGILTVLFLIGALVVDVGFWFSERRDLQKIADAGALAGAQEYIDDPAGAWDTLAAEQKAQYWADQNGAGISNTGLTITSGTAGCRDSSDHMPWVEVEAERPSVLYFSQILGWAGFHVRTTARACVGSPITQEGLTPFVVQIDPANPASFECFDADGDPLYGSACSLRNSSSDCVTGQCGFLSLAPVGCGSGNSSDLYANLVYGSDGTCAINQEVTTDTGLKAGELTKGIGDRLAYEVSHHSETCDALFGNNDGYDEFNEVFTTDGGFTAVPSPDNVFYQNDCEVTVTAAESLDGKQHKFIPRLVTIVITDQLTPSAQTTTIKAFAGFYIVGCVRDSDAAAMKTEIETHLDNLGPYLNRCDHTTGQDVVMGVFVKTVTPSGDLGDPRDSDRAVALVK